MATFFWQAQLDDVGGLPTNATLSQPLNSDLDPVVIEHSTSGTGAALEINRVGSTSNLRRLLVWDDIDGEALPAAENYEVFIWFTANGSENDFAGGVRYKAGTGTADLDLYAGQVVRSIDTGRLIKYAGGTFTSLLTDADLVDGFGDYKLRVRVNSDQVQAKIWGAADPEPSGWDFTVTDTDVTGSGLAGYYMANFGTPDSPPRIYAMGFATDGDTAPSENVINLTNATATATGETTADASVDTDHGGGTMWAVASTSSTKPSLSQLSLGQDHEGNDAVWSETRFPSEEGTESFSVDGLSSGTTYWIHFAQEHDNGEDVSAVVTSNSFNTATLDGMVFHDGTLLVFNLIVGEEPPVEDLTLESDFDSGNMDLSQSSVTNPGSSEPEVFLQPRITSTDGTTDRYNCFHVRLDGAADKRPQFTLSSNGFAGSIGAWRPWYSEDGVNWTRWGGEGASFDTDDGEGNIAFQFPDAFTSDTVWVAEMPPYPVSRSKDLIDWLEANHPDLIHDVPSTNGDPDRIIAMGTEQTDESGRTIPSQPFYGYMITDASTSPADGQGKRKALFFGGIHAGESDGDWVMEGGIEFLVSGDPLANDLLRDYEWHIYPCANPMGRWGGHHRGQWDPANLTKDPNRDWGPLDDADSFELESSQIIRDALVDDIGDEPVWWFIDHHSSIQGGNSPLMFWFINNFSEEADLEDWAANHQTVMSGISSDYDNFGGEPGASGGPNPDHDITRGHIWREYGTNMSFTSETRQKAGNGAGLTSTSGTAPYAQVGEDWSRSLHGVQEQFPEQVGFTEEVVEAEQFQTAFDESDPRAGWTERWNATNSQWTAEDGDILRHEATETNRRFLSWDVTDAPDAIGDVEIVAQVRLSQVSGNQARLIVRGGGTVDDESGYALEIREAVEGDDGPTFRLVSFEPEYTNLSNIEVPAGIDLTGGFFMSLRAESGLIQGRIWPMGGSRPSSAQVSSSNSSHASGRIGLGAYTQTGQRDFAYAAAATEGEIPVIEEHTFPEEGVDHFTTRFDEIDPLGDWEERWNADNSEWTVEDGDIIRHTATESAPRFLQWLITDSPNNINDVEIVAQLRTTDLGSEQDQGRVYVRASGVEDDEAGYFSVIRFTDADEVPSFVLVAYRPSYDELAKADIPGTVDIHEGFFMSVRAEGSTIEGRIWAEGETRPETPTLSVTDTGYTSGATGIGAWSREGARDFNYVSAATGGGTPAVNEQLWPGIHVSGFARVSVEGAHADATGVKSMEQAPLIFGGGGVTVESLKQVSAAPTVSAAGDIDVIGTVEGVAVGRAIVSGAGETAVDAQKHGFGETAVTGAGETAISGQKQALFDAVVSGSGEIAVDGDRAIPTAEAAILVSGAGTIAVSGTKTARVAVVVSGAGAIDVAGVEGALFSSRKVFEFTGSLSPH